MALARGAGDFDLANRRRFQWPVVPGALIRDAPVLLLDEPTPGAREVILFEKSEMRKTESSPLRSGLDANTAASLAQALRRQSHKQSPFSASCTCTVVPYHGFAFVFLLSNTIRLCEGSSWTICPPDNADCHTQSCTHQDSSA